MYLESYKPFLVDTNQSINKNNGFDIAGKFLKQINKESLLLPPKRKNKKKRRRRL